MPVCASASCLSPVQNGAIFFPGTFRYTEVLSSDLQKNILATLLRLGAVRKIKGYVGFDPRSRRVSRNPKSRFSFKIPKSRLSQPFSWSSEK